MFRGRLYAGRLYAGSLYGGTETVVEPPVISPVAPDVQAYGGGGGGYYNAEYDQYEFPIGAHDESEEEEIIMTILLKVAHVLIH